VCRKNSEFSPLAFGKFVFRPAAPFASSCSFTKIFKMFSRRFFSFRVKNSSVRSWSCSASSASVVAFLFFLVASPRAPSQTLRRNDSERQLFELLNGERTAQGLPELQWDDALFKAARRHALLMLNLNILEHQLPGEPALDARLTAAGARFAFIEENIAVGKDPRTIHAGWMDSPGHRRNILDPRITAVGIAMVRGTGGLFAVEDFSQSLANLSFEQQEKQVTAVLTAKGWRVTGAAGDARKACNSNAQPPGTGARSWSVVRFETTDLSALAPELEKKLRREPYHNVTVGACRTSEAAGFARYRIALLFF
jgi:uncharacterized protein YkwD